MIKGMKMKKFKIKFLLVLLFVPALIFAQQQRLMFEKLVEKNGIMYASGEKKPFTGRVFDNYRNKGRKLAGEFRNGKKHGNWTHWKENGKTDREESYFQGDKNGNWVYYTDDGIKERIEKYEKGKETGHKIFYYDNGKKEKEEFHIKGLRDGKWTAWYNNGKKEKEEN